MYKRQRKIQQVLYNLIDNAIKFSENDSLITVEVSEKNEKVFISVKDQDVYKRQYQTSSFLIFSFPLLYLTSSFSVVTTENFILTYPSEPSRFPTNSIV